MANNRTSHLVAALAVSVLVAPPVFADPDKDESGHGRWRGRGGDYEYKAERGRHGGKFKEEYWDGHCKVERKFDGGEYKEERKCRAPSVYVQPATPVYVHPAPVIVQPAPVMVPGTVVVEPPTVVVRPAPDRAPTVIIQPAEVALAAPPPVVVYPPWVVYEQGRTVYRVGQAPEPIQVEGAFHCQSERVGQVLGGITGAVAGSHVGKGNGRTAATIGGAVVGVLIGGSIGRRIDAGDQACVGRVLEFAPVGKRIEWVGAGSTQYVLVPGRVERRGDKYCREFDAEVLTENGGEQVHGVACRQADGAWVASR